MYLIVGLGNPTAKYEKTRHNAGFDVIDAIADKYGIELNLRKGKAFCKGVRIPDEKLSPLRNISFSAYIGKELIDGKETYGYSPKPDEWKR